MTNKAVYLDAVATTPVDPEVIKAMAPFWGEKFGNPSSIHSFGRDALMAIDEARETTARFFDCRPGEVYFTGSATEADNWALSGIVKGVAKKHKLKLSDLHIVTTAIEHKAILSAAQALEKEVVKVSYVKPDKAGIVSAEAIKAAIKPNTVLVSVMYVNNEVGSVMPVTEIGRAIEENKEERIKKGESERLPIFFHTDAVQAVQFFECRLGYLKADALSFSGHKIYGPKGVGGLVIRQDAPLEPFILGGVQESGKRAGTENVAHIVGAAKALELVAQNKRNGLANKIEKLRDELKAGILKAVPNAFLNGPKENARRAPNNLNIRFKGLDGQSLLMALDLAGVAASSGSACASGSIDPSHVLISMGLSEQAARSSVRFSLSKHTTKEEIGEVLKILPPLVAKVRR